MKRSIVIAIILAIVIVVALSSLICHKAQAQAISGGIALTPQKAKSIPMLSFKRINTPWFAPITIGRIDGDDRNEFGFGISYILSTHTAISAEGYKDWNSSGKVVRASLKLFW